MSGWKPFETAPREDILGYCNGTTSEWLWDSSLERHYPVSYDQHGCGCCSGSADKPTHWRPLLKPPEVKK